MIEVNTPLDPTQFAHLRVSTMRRTHIPRYCTLPDCDGEIRTMGMCAAHYARWRLGMPVDVVIKRRTRRYS